MRDELQSLLERATPYEAWHAPLDETLRRGVFLSVASTVLGLLVILVLPDLYRTVAHSGMFLRDPVVAVLDFVAAISPALGAVNAASLAVHLALLFATRGWETGRPIHHWAAGAMVLVGAANALIVSIGLSLLLVNVVVMILVGIVAIIVLLAWAAGSG